MATNGERLREKYVPHQRLVTTCGHCKHARMLPDHEDAIWCRVHSQLGGFIHNADWFCADGEER